MLCPDDFNAPDISGDNFPLKNLRHHSNLSVISAQDVINFKIEMYYIIFFSDWERKTKENE